MISIAHADSSEIINIIENNSIENLSDEEIEGILFSVEEEKLARDIYLELYEKWNIRIFSNIASSEQNHMDVMSYLIERYDLENPLQENKGEFTNEELTTLYNQLIEKGSKSLTNALEVGATIEDMDIADLKKQINLTDNQDLKIAYQNLMKASRNHMRSFTMQLERQDTQYFPQYINESEYEKIINSEKEKGVLYGAEGEFMINCEEENKHKEGGRQHAKGNSMMSFVDEQNTNQANQNMQTPNFFQKMMRGFLSWFE